MMQASLTTVVTASLILALLLVTSDAHPHHHSQALYYQQQQQQLLPGSFYYQGQQPGSVYAPGPGVAKVASVVHHSSAATVGSDASHYVIVYPPAGVSFAQPPPLFRQQPIALGQGGPNVVYREEEESVGEAPEQPPAQTGWWATIINIFAPSNTNNVGVAPTTAAPVVAEAEETTSAPASVVSAASDNKPEKVVDEIMMAVEQNLPLNSDEQKGALETLDEPQPEVLEGGADNNSQGGGDTLVRVDGGGTKYVAVQKPQFYGNFANLDHLAGQGGPVAGFLLGRTPEAPQAPQLPLVPQFPVFPPPQYQYQPLPFPKHLPLVPELAPGEAPGAAAVEFQKTLQAAKLAAGQESSVVPVVGGQRSAVIPGSKHVDISQNLEKFLAQAHQSHASKQQESLHGLVNANVAALLPQGIPDLQTLQGAQNHPGLINVGPGYQNVYYLLSKQALEESQAVAVNAQKEKKDKVDDDDKIHPVEDQAGPSVAQAKPQAIAVAGPGGTAAATPIATALVGPGGLAVSAPTATAVAGQTGGGTLTGPAAAIANKYMNLTGGKKTSDELNQHGFLAYGTAI